MTTQKTNRNELTTEDLASVVGGGINWCMFGTALAIAAASPGGAVTMIGAGMSATAAFC